MGGESIEKTLYTLYTNEGRMQAVAKLAGKVELPENMLDTALKHFLEDEPPYVALQIAAAKGDHSLETTLRNKIIKWEMNPAYGEEIEAPDLSIPSEVKEQGPEATAIYADAERIRWFAEKMMHPWLCGLLDKCATKMYERVIDAFAEIGYNRGAAHAIVDGNMLGKGETFLRNKEAWGLLATLYEKNDRLEDALDALHTDEKDPIRATEIALRLAEKRTNARETYLKIARKDYERAPAPLRAAKLARKLDDETGAMGLFADAMKSRERRGNFVEAREIAAEAMLPLKERAYIRIIDLSNL